MKLIRIIPSLLVNNDFLIKGEKFKNHDYVGDVYNAVKIFSEKNAHEITILDISARNNNTIFKLDLIKKIKKEIFVPLTIGGGINNIDDASKIIDEGVEKVCLNSVLNNNLEVITSIANKFGSQSVVVSVDVKKEDGKYYIYFNNGNLKSNLDLNKHLKKLENCGAGEIILTSINKEGTRSGFDIELYLFSQNQINLPIIAQGGAANLESFKELFEKTKISSASAGAAFVYFGKRKAVLINYPEKKEIDALMQKYESTK